MISAADSSSYETSWSLRGGDEAQQHAGMHVTLCARLAGLGSRGVLGNTVVSDSAAFCDRDVALGPRTMIVERGQERQLWSRKLQREKWENGGDDRDKSWAVENWALAGLSGSAPHRWNERCSRKQPPTEGRARKRGPGGCLYGEGGVIGARSDVIAGGDWPATTNVQGTEDEGACEKRGPRRAPSCQIDNVQAPISVQDGPRQDWA